MRYFEFACSRNEGRSPVAELIAQWHLEQRGLQKEYGAISSGSHRSEPNPNEVQATSDANVPLESLVKMIEQGLKHKIFPDAEITAIKQSLENQNRSELQNYFSTANRIFKEHERHFRADAVRHLVNEKGLKGYSKAHSDQAVPRHDVVAVFGMANGNTERIRDVYRESSYKPLIETLSAYVTGDPQAELPNAFAQGSTFYHDVIEQLWVQIPMAIDKFLNSKST